MSDENAIKSFLPLVDKDCKILILGSIPSVKSLQMQEYYAHPRNAFWFIMSRLFNFDINLKYQQRLKILLKNRVALFDVISSCKRKGSMDSAIKEPKHQNFEEFFEKYPNIDTIFCNGTKAYNEFTKIYKGDKKIYKLPSTSPANARMNKYKKLEEWKIIADLIKVPEGNVLYCPSK